MQQQINKLLSHEITDFTSSYHCGACDFTFSSSLDASDISGDVSSASQPAQPFLRQPDFQRADFQTEQASGNQKPPQQPDFKETYSSDQTQVIDSDFFEEIRTGATSTNTINTNPWETSESHDSFQLSGGSEDYQSPPQVSPDYRSSNYSVDQNIQHEDYSQYAVSSFSENASREDFWGGSSDPDSFDSGKPSGSDRQTRESAETILGPSTDNPLSGKPLFGGFGSQKESENQPKQDFGNSIEQNNERSTSATLMVLITPILIILAALSYLSFHIENNLKSADSAFNLLFPSSLREPPAGLYILEPNIRPLVLDSGDIVNVVQGKIVNKTSRTIDAIQIEGLGFSVAGQLSHREKVMLGNPVSISTVKLKTLTPSNIKEIQSRELRKSLKLRPNSEMDFIFVFTDPVSPRVLDNNKSQSLNGDMSSFALRIFAVR